MIKSIENNNMKEIYSKNMKSRLSKEAGFWDKVKDFGGKIKDLYNKGVDFAQKAQLGWELGKMNLGQPSWKQRFNAMMYSNAYPMTADGKPVYITKNEKGERIPYNPYFIPGLKERVMNSRTFKRLPKGKKINPLKENEPGIHEAIQEALTIVEATGDSKPLDILEQQGIIINDSEQQQQGTQQTGANPAQPVPVQPAVSKSPNSSGTVY